MATGFKGKGVVTIDGEGIGQCKSFEINIPDPEGIAPDREKYLGSGKKFFEFYPSTLEFSRGFNKLKRFFCCGGPRGWRKRSTDQYWADIVAAGKNE